MLLQRINCLFSLPVVNVDDTVGAVGFISRILPKVYPISIIKVDEATGEPVRNSKGLCQTCEPGEPGVFIGKIIPNDPSRAFLGYVDKSASKKKIVYDVFTKGDSAFISGRTIYLYWKINWFNNVCKMYYRRYNGSR